MKPGITHALLPLVLLTTSQVQGGEAADKSQAPAQTAHGVLIEDCVHHPLGQALPETDQIANRPLHARSCTGLNMATAFYGRQDVDGNRHGCEISLFDGKPAPSEADQWIDTAQMMQLNYTAAKASVDLIIGLREDLLQDPEQLALWGGPDHLPVVETLSTGDRYGIAVPSKLDPDPEASGLGAMLKDRYWLHIECDTPTPTHSKALQVYSPYVNALHLDRLP